VENQNRRWNQRAEGLVKDDRVIIPRSKLDKIINLRGENL